MTSSKRFQSIVILTGAGISAESGIRTFRAADGLWEDHHIADVATPEGFARDPKLVHKFYNERRRQLKDPNVGPNPAHLALARLEEAWEGDFLLVTQNVDDLHERAGSRRVLHMHGALNKVACRACAKSHDWREDTSELSLCPSCAGVNQLRPDIVWFGEMPYYLDTIGAALATAQIFVSIGTSGAVYPAAGFARDAWKAHRVEINLNATEISRNFHEHRVGPASVEVEKFVAELLADEDITADLPE